MEQFPRFLCSFPKEKTMEQQPGATGIAVVHRFPPPTASTDDELRRLTHRLNGVAAVHRYEDHCTVMCHMGEYRARSPDPTDRRLSKRAWENAVQQWRNQLAEQAACVRRHVVVAAFGLERSLPMSTSMGQ